MRANRKKPARRDPQGTRDDLIAAAETIFNSDGFWGTDTNRIARAAGYAPQTFYRHFTDKTEIFLAAYDRWWRSEVDAIGDVDTKDPASADEVARIALAFHRKWQIFRRSLRHLALEDDRARAARAAARRAQMARAKAAARVKRSDAEWIVILLEAERLCDAAADGELADLGFSKTDIHAMIARVVAPLAGK